MGVQSVSQLQYDASMQALVHVHERDHVPSEDVDDCGTLMSFHAEHKHSSKGRPKGVSAEPSNTRLLLMAIYNAMYFYVAHYVSI